MRGFPLLQMFAIAALFALAGIPVWKLTRPARTQAAASDRTAGAAPTAVPARQTATIEAHFAPAPIDFEVNYLGQPLLSGHGRLSDFSGPWTAQLPAEGADLALQAHWAAPGDGGHAAGRLTVHFADGHQDDRTVWGDTASPMTEVVTIKP